MVTLQTAENALKQVYLGVIANQLNVGVSPIYSMIRQTTKDILGKEIVKMAPYGINGGFSAGSETDPLPKPSSTGALQFKSALKNLYGKIEISDKAIRAASNNVGAFVDILAYEMDELVKGCSYNLNRMLWGSGSGVVATVTAADNEFFIYTCDSVRNLVEGMMVDVYRGNVKTDFSPLRIATVDRAARKITFSSTGHQFIQADTLYVQNSKSQELTGIDALWMNRDLYGIRKENYPFLQPVIDTTDAELSDIRMQEIIDRIEDQTDSKINMIACSRPVRRIYQQYLEAFRRNVDITELAGGYKTITHNGVPVVADRFIEDNTMYFLNTEDFTLHQLCDWKWLEDESGRVLRQNENYPTYSATLVKYADLICDRPAGQGKITNIRTTITNPTVVSSGS